MIKIKSSFLQLFFLPTILGCVNSFTKLENGIFSNSENIYSLIKAFYPVNQHPALLVEVNYYINLTNDIVRIPIHPIIVTNETMLHKADYVFLWSYSSVLLFAPPTILEQISFKFITLSPHVAHIVLEPFCTSLNEDHVLNLLNEVTIWLKSYAVKGGKSVSDGIDPSVQGYSLFKPENASNDEAIPLHLDKEIYVWMNSIAWILFGIFSQVLSSVLLWKYHDKWCEKPNATVFKIFEVQFHRKNIFWSLVICLSVGEVIPSVMAAIHLFSHGFQSGLLKHYILWFLVFVSHLFYEFIIALYFAIKGKTMELPESLKKINCCSMCSYILRFIAIFSLTVSAFIVSIVTYGLILAILINPLRVSSMIIVTITTATIVIVYLAYVFEQYANSNKVKDQYENSNKAEDECENSKNAKEQNFGFTARIVLTVCAHLIILTMVCLFIGLFGAVYLNVILFTGPDKTGVLTQLSQFFPALLLGLIAWILKKASGISGSN